ncbi:hypothetical protein [Streptosporangium sp. NPDC002607]
MPLTEILFLLPALSTALNIAIAAGLIARAAGASTAWATLTGAGAISLALYFAAVGAYH